ncbi:MAG: 2-succinyl-5-enolpyruvyl-6-hydroxy-3-cyclohexene-1-carboxylic-acid synthase [Armatimonadota bacterium]|nr:2-succinyl-5-enolpyruvyl-6-hydroxy-3-cyclohexene-1-carboxylic-acid synthase [Armatimonadota bacterium]
MRPENATYAYVGAFTDELARCGIRHLCLCPGSRLTPLALCAARHPAIRVWTLIDERSAAYFAVGMAKALRLPVAVLSTSGTAAANFLPAVVEARYGRVPLVVLTADRPHELRDAGAPQTIDQIRLYGVHAKWFVDVAPPQAAEPMLRYVRALAGQAAAIAQDDPAGPVHLNFPFREPLVPVAAPEELPPPENRVGDAWEGRGAGQPYARAHAGRRTPDAETAAVLARSLARVGRGLIVCGPYDDPAFPEAVSRLAAALGYPVLADPLSQVRCGPHDRTLVVDAYDPLLRVGEVAGILAPEVILRFGGTPASKPLVQYLQAQPRARHVVVDGAGAWHDPTRLASEVVHADPVVLCQAVAALLESGAARASAAPASAWTARWLRLSGEARLAVQQRLGAVCEPFEGKVFAELAGLLSDGVLLYVGNSMPVRDLDSFFPSTPAAIRFLGNRGASGIDGLVSCGLGAAASGAGPVVLVLGDLAFYHDLNGLLAGKLHGLAATIILLNNDGGGIFSFLPQAGYPEHFEALFGTPHGLDFRHAAEMYGAGFRRADTWEDFRLHVRDALASGTLSVVEVRTRRDRNVVLHQEVWAAVRAAVCADLAAASGKAP